MTPIAPPKHKGWYSRSYLPHFDAPGLYQSLTFRLHDAIPQEVLLRLEGEARLGLITDLERRRNIEGYMDAGHGACWLRRPAVARIVHDVLMHFDGERYRLLAWCVMPNHVHVLMETFEGCPMDRVLTTWKSFSARKANALLGREGPFWQRDYFDRYVRDAAHYDRLIFYIENNPVKAGLVERAEDWRFGSAAPRKGALRG
uniref:Putative DNA methylase n=1 Tax=Candidatus Kentrum sp. FM TaxID=2126340 RepID=A0A450SA93_9GAMM|nr:MAG: putative DNA methylase [Candidatus Kentron sp. FM]VFJ48962.1 MAG: putative DNA methylase [Candidatus Kentron sp. FM]VFK13885.1 MAG: putative DNA methylase [Candidatus Kentron sp. FM]